MWVIFSPFPWQYVFLSCLARFLSAKGGLSRALARASSVRGGLVRFKQKVSISSRQSDIVRCSFWMHLSVSVGTCNCTPREYHLSLTGCSSLCRYFRSSWPTGVVNTKKIPGNKTLHHKVGRNQGHILWYIATFVTTKAVWKCYKDMHISTLYSVHAWWKFNMYPQDFHITTSHSGLFTTNFICS